LFICGLDCLNIRSPAIAKRAGVPCQDLLAKLPAKIGQSENRKRGIAMDVRAAIAVAAGKPLEVTIRGVTF
jgi:hypothetical protein